MRLYKAGDKESESINFTWEFKNLVPTNLDPNSTMSVEEALSIILILWIETGQTLI